MKKILVSVKATSLTKLLASIKLFFYSPLWGKSHDLYLWLAFWLMNSSSYSRQKSVISAKFYVLRSLFDVGIFNKKCPDSNMCNPTLLYLANLYLSNKFSFFPTHLGEFLHPINLYQQGVDWQEGWQEQLTHQEMEPLSMFLIYYRSRMMRRNDENVDHPYSLTASFHNFLQWHCNTRDPGDGYFANTNGDYFWSNVRKCKFMLFTGDKNWKSKNMYIFVTG